MSKRPGYILGDHWLEVAFGRICAGDSEQSVMADYGWVQITDAEREAVEYALNRLEWPLDGPQLAVVARAAGPSCEVPEHRMKATLRGLLERTRQDAEHARSAAAQPSAASAGSVVNAVKFF